MTNRTRPPRLIAYCRVSTAEQADEGHSLDAQAAHIRAVLRGTGATLVDVYTDAGYSGANLDRPGITAALQALVNGDADGLVVRDLSRLTRSVRDTLDLVDWFDRHNLALRILDHGIDSSTAMGRMHLSMLALFAEWTLETIRENTRNAFRVEGSEPMAKLNAKRAPIAPELRARLVEMHDGGMSYAAIARTLNDEGVPTARGGVRWHHSTVQCAIGNRPPKRRRPATLPDRPRRPRRRPTDEAAA